MLYDDEPTAEEMRPPTEAEVKRAIQQRGPAPVRPEDFLPGTMLDMFEQDYPF